MSKQKRKGDAYERELAAYLRDNLGVNCHRAPLSGGGFVLGSGGADLVGTPLLFVEAKRVEKVSVRDALRQANRNKAETRSPETPIVITRQNRMTTGESLVVLTLDDFLPFYRAALEKDGYVAQPSE
ncbi:MAG: hypothetical protein P8R39_11425 [Alphaproteobacteria bacterium]|nr:hypothetical protein [Alphaproteobacteria bacterium]